MSVSPTVTNTPIENPRSPFEGLLVWLMGACLFTGMVTVVRTNAASTNWAFLQATTVCTLAWSLFSTHYLRSRIHFNEDRNRYRLAEFVLIMFVMRLFVWAFVEGFPSGADFEQMLLQPGNVLTVTWAIYLLFAFMAWVWMAGIKSIFIRMRLTESELAYFKASGVSALKRPAHAPIPYDRHILSRNLQNAWFNGGIVLLICAAMSTFKLSEISTTELRLLSRLPLANGMIAALVVYLLVGLWLISYAHYIRMFAAWLGERTLPQQSVARQWRRTSVVLLLGTAFVSAFLPIGSTIPLARLLTSLVSTLFVVSATVVTFFTNLFMFLFSFLLAPLSGGEVQSYEPPPPVVPPPILSQPVAEPTDLIPDAVSGGIFWMVVLGMVVAALVFVLIGRKYNISLAQMVTAAWQQLRAWWMALRAGVEERTEIVRQELALRRERKAAAQATGQRVMRVNALTPREQIRYFYLAAVRRAADRGVERKPNETPAEFLDDLKDEWPDLSAESEQLTDAFLHARYSKKPVEEDNVGDVKQTWRRMRKSLRKRRGSGE